MDFAGFKDFRIKQEPQKQFWILCDIFVMVSDLLQSYGMITAIERRRIEMQITECHSLNDVRAQIDELDDRIVELIAARNAYVKQAANFKHSVEEIKAKERMEDVMDRVRHKAMELGVSPNLMTNLYTVMIDAMVESEISEFRNAKSL